MHQTGTSLLEQEVKSVGPPCGGKMHTYERICLQGFYFEDTSGYIKDTYLFLENSYRANYFSIFLALHVRCLTQAQIMPSRHG